MTEQDRITVLVAEDHPSYRARIVGLLEALGLHVIVGDAATVGWPARC
jgi:hypothetical protein